MELKEMQFLTYAVGCLADALGISEPEAFNLLDKSHLAEEYIIPCYDVLHTFGREYFANDLIEQLKNRGYLC
ncbi:MAG: DUF3791 domain-containing protein [Bacteroidales bacterium]|nr:DUF3791 domain-containing protein [Bacteroidales bacterium]